MRVWIVSHMIICIYVYNIVSYNQQSDMCVCVCSQNGGFGHQNGNLFVEDVDESMVCQWDGKLLTRCNEVYGYNLYGQDSR